MSKKLMAWIVFSLLLLSISAQINMPPQEWLNNLGIPSRNDENDT